MKKLFLIFATVLFTYGVSRAIVSDDTNEATHEVYITVPTVALVDVENSSGQEDDISFSFNEADLVNEAGSALNFGSLTNTDLYLQYTSLVGSSSTNIITAELGSTNLPDGLSLKLKAASGISGDSGTGNLGSGTGEFATLSSSSAQEIVSSIGSCYTGSGGAYGHQLTFELEIGDNNEAYQALTADSYQVTVLYTITADSE